MNAEIRKLLNAVRARSAAGDLLNLLLLAAIWLGAVFIVYAAADRKLDLPVKTRAIISFSLLAIAAGCVALYFSRKARGRGLLRSALQVERAAGSINNQLVLLVEQQLAGSRLPRYLSERIERDLNRKLSSIKARDVVRIAPSRPVRLAAALVVAVYVALFFFLPQLSRDELGRLIFLGGSSAALATGPDPLSVSGEADALGADGIQGLRVVLSPPAYTRQSQVVQTGEGNIAALVGTRVDVFLKLNSVDASALLSVGGGEGAEMIRAEDGAYQGQFIISEDSNYRVSLFDSAARKAIWEGIYSVRAIKDSPPQIHITRPAGDLLFKAGERPASINVDVVCTDDYGVGHMRLKYIKSTGEGDASKFEGGEVALADRVGGSGGGARGSARLSLDVLGVEPGSSIIFHAEARDRNDVTGPGIGFSESLVIQIGEVEKAAISLDDLLPPDNLKHLTSQRMILIKTERLHRRHGKITPPAFLSAAQEIGFEQRRFRESFNEFTEVEATHDHELHSPEPPESEADERERLRDASLPDVPAGASETVREMIDALRAMRRAETALATGETGAAIAFEKEALSHLKAAQKASRYFSRSLAGARPIDTKRRYMGELDSIKSRVERLPKQDDDPVKGRLRAGLVVVYSAARTLSRQTAPGADAARQAAAARDLDRAAEDLLTIKGDKASALVETASKLKLVSKMLYELASARQAVAAGEAARQAGMIGLMSEAAGELLAHLGGENRSAVVLPPSLLNPGARARAARYFKLLAEP